MNLTEPWLPLKSLHSDVSLDEPRTRFATRFRRPESDTFRRADELDGSRELFPP